jgi:hypothetical protein
MFMMLQRVMMRHTVLFYNPATSKGKQRLPLSLLAVAAVIQDDYDLEFIDGNLIDEPADTIIERAQATNSKLLAVTCMPGPQLRQAVPVCQKVKAALPNLTILWGGYFPTQHSQVNLKAISWITRSWGRRSPSASSSIYCTTAAMYDDPCWATKERRNRINERAPYVPMDNLSRSHEN